jgi:hypothetical protein
VQTLAIWWGDCPGISFSAEVRLLKSERVALGITGSFDIIRLRLIYTPVAANTGSRFSLEVLRRLAGSYDGFEIASLDTGKGSIYMRSCEIRSYQEQNKSQGTRVSMVVEGVRDYA